MRRALTAFVFCVLGGCAFEVKLGSTVIVPAGGSGGGGGVVVAACSQSQVLAYEVTLEATAIPASCWLDGGWFEDGGVLQLPEERFTAVFLTGAVGNSFEAPPQTMALVGLAEQRLGNAAPVKLGEAFAGVDRFFVWNDLYETRERVGGPINQQQFIARFDFDRLDTLLTAGTLQLSSRWQCLPGAQGECPTPLPFAQECQVERRLVAQRTTRPANFANPPQNPLLRGQLFLVSLETGALEDAGAICWGSPEPWLVQRRVPGMRRVEWWQMDATGTLFVPPRMLKLGDAPEIIFGPVIPSALQEQITVSMDSPDAREERTTRIEIVPTQCNLAGGARGPARAALFSTWQCSGSGCPLAASTDRGTCDANLNFFVVPIEFGSWTMTSP